MMRDVKILPSLLSANFSNLSADVASVEIDCVGGLHCDIMDGHFVPNITFGPLVVQAVGRVSKLPLHVHLMIERPELYIEAFAQAGARSITVHQEACIHLHRVIQAIKLLGVSAGVALNPSTPVCTLEDVIGDVDEICIMTVNPGFGGQSFIESMLPKIAQTRKLAEDAGVEVDIVVDGGIDITTAPMVVRAGANLLVAGSSVFANHMSPAIACSQIHASAMTAFEMRRSSDG